MSYNVEYFGATWCKVCHIVLPLIEQLCTEYDVTIKKFSIDEDVPEGITKVPTVRLYKDDVLVKTFVTDHVKALQTELALAKGVKLTEDF